MQTKYLIFHTDNSVEEKEIDWPTKPTFKVINSLLEPILNGAYLEHVSVLYEDKRSDMFLDEEGKLKHLSRNEKATAIYRAATLKYKPKTPPETLDFICGTAILFTRIVWF